MCGRRTILVRKKAAAKQRDTKSGEVVRADGNLAYGRSRLAGRVRFTFSVKRIREFEQVGRQAHGYAGRFNAGRIFDAPKELLVKRRNLWCVCVALSRQGEQRGHHVRGIEARVQDRKSTRLNSSHRTISYAVFCLKKKKTKPQEYQTNVKGRVELV